MFEPISEVEPMLEFGVVSEQMSAARHLTNPFQSMRYGCVLCPKFRLTIICVIRSNTISSSWGPWMANIRYRLFLAKWIK